MSRLRDKLGDHAWMIETVRGAGYRLTATRRTQRAHEVSHAPRAHALRSDGGDGGERVRHRVVRRRALGGATARRGPARRSASRGGRDRRSARQHFTSTTAAVPQADDIGRLKKFAVIYEDDGQRRRHHVDVRARRAGLHGRTRPSPGAGVRLLVRRRAPARRLRGHPRARRIRCSSSPRRARTWRRTTTFLRQVMLVAALLSIGFTVLVTWRVVRRLTRGHEAITEAARASPPGDLVARTSLRVRRRRGRAARPRRRRDGAPPRDPRRGPAALHRARRARAPLSAHVALRRAAARAAPIAQRRGVPHRDRRGARLRAHASRRSPRTCSRWRESAPSESRRSRRWRSTRSRRTRRRGSAQKRARRNVELAIDADDSSVLGHAIDLERLLRNLLDNAVRHCPEGGHVRVEARSDGEHRGPLRRSTTARASRRGARSRLRSFLPSGDRAAARRRLRSRPRDRARDRARARRRRQRRGRARTAREPVFAPGCLLRLRLDAWSTAVQCKVAACTDGRVATATPRAAAGSLPGSPGNRRPRKR